MAILKKKNNSEVLIGDLDVAENFWPRMKGLLGTAELSNQSGLWIHNCNSIHTFFMKFAIDCIFLDSSLRVKKIVGNVVPGRLVFPIWGASSVVEVKAGVAAKLNLQAGDELYVGH